MSSQVTEEAPLKLEEVLSLSSLGIEVPVRLHSCVLASEQWLSVQETTPKGSQVVLVDIVNQKTTMRRVVSADAAAINDTAQFLALQAGETVQMFDLTNKKRIKTTMLTNKSLAYWKWVTTDTLVIVTGNLVLHWSSSTPDEPVLMMSLSPRLTGVPVNYRVNPSMQWLLLITVSVFENRVQGHSQLQSLERGCFQILDADAAVFTSIKLPKNKTPSELIAFASRTETGAKLCIAQIGKPPEGEQPYVRKTEELQVPNGIPGDFPAVVEAEAKLGIISILWKNGFIAVHDVETAECVLTYNSAVSGIYSSVPRADGGLVVLNKMGQIISISMVVDKVVPYLEARQNLQLAVRLAVRAELPTASNIMALWFDRLLKEGLGKEAALFAAKAPHFCLRTPETLDKIRQLPIGGPAALMTYFGELLDNGRLTAWEAVELCRPVIYQGRKDLVEKWLREDRLDCSPALGDLLLPYNTTLALSVYIRSNSIPQALYCFAALGEVRKLLDFAEQMSFQPDFHSLVCGLLPDNKETAIELLGTAISDGKLNIDLQRIVDLLLEKDMYEEAVSLLTKAVIGDGETTGDLQTKLLSLHLSRSPPIADALLNSNTLTHFDRAKVASLCEQAGLTHHALQLYTHPDDWQRVLSLPHPIPLKVLQSFFSTAEPEVAIRCLQSLIVSSCPGYANLAAQSAIACFPSVGVSQLVNVFEDHGEMQGLFTFLDSVISQVDDEDVNFNYIFIAVKLGKWTELEHFCLWCTNINASRVRSFLMEHKPKQPLALMIICDRHNFVKDLVTYLINENIAEQLGIFVSEVNSARTPEVVDYLLTQHTDEGVVQLILSYVSEEMVSKVATVAEMHCKLPLLLSWLEKLRESGSNNVWVHTTLAKIAIQTNANPERFLHENRLYDHKEVGRFCELRNPELAVVAYSQGCHDEDLLRVCGENGLLKAAARHLLHRCDVDLWKQALLPDNADRSTIVENIANLVSAEAYSTEEISVAVKALMAADLPGQLVPLLETLVFDCPEFARHRNLQNLLILSAMKADKRRVKELITSLQDYDASDVAVIARNNEMFEEAFAIYERSGEDVCAMDVLLKDLKDMDRALTFAQRSGKTQVWVMLGQARLAADQVELAVDALIRAEDSSCYQMVVQKASEGGLWDDLVRYLEVARKCAKEPVIDSELLYAYAKTGRMTDLSKMAAEHTLANVQEVADRCLKEDLLEAAKILYGSFGCHARLGETLAKLGDLEGAVASARKAGNIQSWRTICSVALDKGDLEVGRVAGRYLARQSDQVEDVVLKFESMNYSQDIICVLESLLGNDPIGAIVFTQLALLYIKHDPEKCRGFLDEWWQRLNVPKVLKALEEAHMWNELGILLVNHGDYCEAVAVMMTHPTEAWNHACFKDLLLKVMNSQLVQPVINFYLEFKPMLLNDVLLTLGSRLDAGRVVSAITSVNKTALCRTYFESRLSEDNPFINAVLCDLLIQQDEFTGLKSVLDTQKNVNLAALATRLEEHDLMGFRVIAVDLYRRCRRWNDALRVCQKFRLHQEAIQVAAESGDGSLVKVILNIFLEEKRVDSFSAALLHCCHLIQLDVVLELAWRYNVWSYAMPYFIQVACDLTEGTAPKEQREDSPKNKDRMLMWTSRTS